MFSGIHETIGRRTRIGRDSENDIVVDDVLVSRFHAELRARPDGLHELVDLGSRNGTFVNGRAGDRATVAELDIVGVGHHTFRLVGLGLEKHVDTGSVVYRCDSPVMSAAPSAERRSSSCSRRIDTHVRH